MKIARTLVFAALGMLTTASPSTALLHLCPTDSPGPCAAQVLDVLSGEVIELYVQGSNGVNVTIDVSGGWIEGFNPDSLAIVEFHPTSFDPTTMQIKIAGVRAIPGDPTGTTLRLGSLTVNASSGSFQAWVVAGSKGVGWNSTIAEDVIEDINPVPIPEPAQWLMLTAGSTVLAALGLRRSRPVKRRM